MLANAIAIFAGTAESNARPEVAAKLAALDSTARTWLAAMDRAGAGELFAGLPLGTSDPNLSASYQHLYEIALATKRPGPASDLQGNEQVRARVAEKLVWLHENYYGDQSKGYYGNWFNWEIGISTYVSKTLALLDAPAAPDHAVRRPRWTRTCATARTATSTSTRASTPARTSSTSPPTGSCRAR